MKLRWHPVSARIVGLALAAALAFLCGVGSANAAESALSNPAPLQFLTNDVIAFVGGEDVVEMQRNGYLELLLTAALPHHKLRFRNLAFEGDTVFEQHRQLNFPSWEQQLERVGATVVIAQFGQAESLQGTNGLGKFVEAYGKLLDRFTNGARRVILLELTSFERGVGSEADWNSRTENLSRYQRAIANLALARHPTVRFHVTFFFSSAVGHHPTVYTRDGLHLNVFGHWRDARSFVKQQGPKELWPGISIEARTGRLSMSEAESLRQLIIEKNRLWFDYWRPQNWAFLNGDRTEQPSSRDHRDPKKRWFPEEMEKFLPLIEAKEREIWEAAANLAKGE